MSEPFPAPDFTLTYVDGRDISISDFQGKIVLLYFGYTFCPDVCPSTLLDLKRAVNELGDEGENVQVMMVSVDPKRDTPEVVAEYAAHFHPTFIGLSGTEEEIAQAAGLYGIYYEAHEGTAESGYLVDHTASVILIDKAGNFRATYSFGTTPEEFAHDLKILLKE
ncbi:MAG: SCO family protein [Candidatus Thermofonsia bacterium]|nr:MAG: SCO family protein [Candidatus Thermofonsia bacterium]